MVKFFAGNEEIEAAIKYMLINNVPVKKIDISYIESHMEYLFKNHGENIIPIVNSLIPYAEIPYIKKQALKIAKQFFPDFYIDYKE